MEREGERDERPVFTIVDDRIVVENRAVHTYWGELLAVARGPLLIELSIEAVVEDDLQNQSGAS